METLYRKVAVSERLPKINGNYFTDKNRSFYFNQEVNKFMDDEGDFVYPKYWLEEISDPTAQLKADKAELLEMCGTLMEHLKEEQGYESAITSAAFHLIQKMKQ